VESWRQSGDAADLQAVGKVGRTDGVAAARGYRQGIDQRAPFMRTADEGRAFVPVNARIPRELWRASCSATRKERYAGPMAPRDGSSKPTAVRSSWISGDMDLSLQQAAGVSCRRDKSKAGRGRPIV